jgi:uncharacterized protein (UPF0371 family)
MQEGFDNDKYIQIQSQKIKERFSLFDKLYLEVGGKLFDDSHAARILPGFKNDVKINMFKELKDDLEIIFCINSYDIEKNKTRGEYGISYSQELLKLISNSKQLGLNVNAVVITLYNNQIGVDKFIKKLNRNDIKTFIHKKVKGYPLNVELIVSEEGFGSNIYIPTTKKLIIVNAPGPGSGKLATCLSQIYHENLKGINAGYAKFETFPVWNLPLSHPINLAYEAATADLKDFNLIDKFHLEKYGIEAVNYNRDIESFPILKNILKKVLKKDIYYSPTDMGVNMLGFCIEDDNIIREASKKEIVRRYYKELNNYKMGICDEETYKKIKSLMNKLNIDENILEVVRPALEKKEQENGKPSIALKIKNKIITGKQSDLMTAPGAVIINALKYLGNIPDDIHLLSPNVLEPILKLKNMMNSGKRLLLSEILTALSICSVTNPLAEKALSFLSQIKNAEGHSTYIIMGNDKVTLNELKINITCENEFLDYDDI